MYTSLKLKCIYWGVFNLSKPMVCDYIQSTTLLPSFVFMLHWQVEVHWSWVSGFRFIRPHQFSNSLFLSLASNSCNKAPWQDSLKTERVYCLSQFKVQPVMTESQESRSLKQLSHCTNCDQETKQWLFPRVLFTFFILYSPGSLAQSQSLLPWVELGSWIVVRG